MSNIKNLRASDQKSFSSKYRKDFVARKHTSLARQIYMIALALIVIAVSVAYLVYNNMIYASFVCDFVGLLLLVIGKHIGRLKTMLENTEFLNALFSSSLSAGYKFCIIVKNDDGQIVYLNHGFQNLFPEILPIEERTLGTLLTLYKAPETDKQNLLQAVKKKTEKETALKVETGKARKKTTLKISVEPIARPDGFCIIRGI